MNSKTFDHLKNNSVQQDTASLYLDPTFQMCNVIRVKTFVITIKNLIT